MTIEHWIERLLPCPCTALASAPFPECPECGGDGESYQEIALVVEYAVHRASRGARDRYGAPLEPDEDGGVEMLAVTDENGREIELTRSEEDRIAEACMEDVESRCNNYD